VSPSAQSFLQNLVKWVHCSTEPL